MSWVVSQLELRIRRSFMWFGMDRAARRGRKRWSGAYPLCVQSRVSQGIIATFVRRRGRGRGRGGSDSERRRGRESNRAKGWWSPALGREGSGLGDAAQAIEEASRDESVAPLGFCSPWQNN